MQSDVNFSLVLCKPASLIIQPKFNQCKRFVLHPHFPFIYLTISILGSSIIFGLSLKYTLRFVPSRREGNITSRKIKVLKTKMKNLLGESLTHLDNEFEKFKRGILKVKDYLFTFLSNPSVPYDNNASERGVRKIKIKQKVSGCFRTDGGADDFAKLHSITETAMKNGNSKFNAILAVVQQ